MRSVRKDLGASPSSSAKRECMKKRERLYSSLLRQKEANFIATVFNFLSGSFCVHNSDDVSVFDAMLAGGVAADRIRYEQCSDSAVDIISSSDKFAGIVQGSGDINVYIIKSPTQKKLPACIDREKPFIAIAVSSKMVHDNVIYCREKRPGQNALVIFCSDDLFEKVKEKTSLRAVKPATRYAKRAPYPVFLPGDDILESSKINVIPCSEEVGLYYRDLFAHKLGVTKAERYFLILLDGKVFGVFGVMLGEVYRLTSDRYFETFGFTAYSEKFPRSGRLLMMIITSMEAKKVIVHTSGKNRYYKLVGMRTTCLSKYRNSKSNNGIVITENRERMPNGMYKIHYYANFRKDTFSDCVKRFLREEREFNGEK